MSQENLNVLVLDDENDILWVLKEGLEDKKIKVYTASCIDEAYSILQNNQILVCIVDIFLGDINTIEYVNLWSKSYPEIYFIIITAQNTSTNVIESIKAGAVDFFLKPFDLDELKKKILSFKPKPNSTKIVNKTLPYDFQSKCKKMLEIYKLIGKVAKSNINVLIEGETGTGKEIIARMLHYKSDRSDMPFIPINMAALPDELVESELFGHSKGAFTGANNIKKGKFELANRGTIFLDEISEMSYAIQSKLLRVLQEKEVTRLGADGTIKLDVRIIAATNKELDALVEKKLFREDLYYRLKVISVKLPGLNERQDDIELMVDYFLEKYSYLKDNNIAVSNETLDVLKCYNWPGNVRELENSILYAIINTDTYVINPENLPRKVVDNKKHVNDGNSIANDLYRLATQLISMYDEMDNCVPFEEYITITETPLIRAAMDFSSNNKSKAAKILGINRNTLRKKLERYEI